MNEIRFQPPGPEAQSLEAACCQATVRTLRVRLQIVPLASRGRRPHQNLASGLWRHLETVRRSLDRHLESGLAGLRLRETTGAQASIPPERAEQALDRANWTHAEPVPITMDGIIGA
jgi:hypothetical protein